MPEFTDAYIGMGSNIAPQKHLEQALTLLRDAANITGLSSFFRTEPIGADDQPTYLNGVVRIRTSLPPLILKQDVLRAIEDACGRKRTADKYAPRTLDLDLLLHGDAVIESQELVLPSPELFDRPFYVCGILEIDPEATLPPDGKPLRSILRQAEGSTLVVAQTFTRTMKERFAP